jgi:hypothetical protein
MSAGLSVVVDPENGHLLCPLCGGAFTHVDDVFVAGRPREDGPFVPVHVDSEGRVRQGALVPMPVGADGRRHSIGVQGSCETCAGRFILRLPGAQRGLR